MLNLRLKIIEYIFEHELQSMYLLAPIAFGLGVTTYFNLSSEPQLTYWAISLAGLTLLSFLSFKFDKFFFTIIFITLFVAGFTSGIVRTISVKSPFVQDDDRVTWVRGRLEDIERNGNTAKMILSDLDLWRPDVKKFSAEYTPKNIRITVRTKIDDDIRVGNMVAFKAMLQPPSSRPVFPGGYDYAKVAYFRQIGGVGYAISPVKLFERTEPGLINKFEDYYYKKVHNIIKDKDLAGMVIAQITADRFEVSDELQEKVRNAGLSHLLAISGMNITAVTIWCFFMVRSLFSFFPGIALTHDTKKLSCVVAIFLGFIYLMVTGMPISALRAFLMTLLFFLAIIFDRFSFSLHSVAVAALAIMLVMPEQILFPSLQLSFAAVIGLIGFYGLYQEYFKKDRTYDRGIIEKIFFVFIATLATTIAASFATIPLIVFHFGTIQNYTILANMICVPIVELLLLPFAFLAIIAMPLGLEWLPLKLAELGAIVLRDVSYYVSEKKDSVTHFASLPNYFLWLVIGGFLILFIFKTRIRFIGVPLIITGYAMVFLPPTTPDFVVSESGNLVVMKAPDGNYEYFGAKRQSFALYQFISKLGSDKVEYKEASDECNKEKCIYRNIVFGKELTAGDCDGFDYLVNLGKDKITCKTTEVIDKDRLKAHGTHLIYINEKKLLAVDDLTTDRPWYQR